MADDEYNPAAASGGNWWQPSPNQLNVSESPAPQLNSFGRLGLWPPPSSVLTENIKKRSHTETELVSGSPGAAVGFHSPERLISNLQMMDLGLSRHHHQSLECHGDDCSHDMNNFSVLQDQGNQFNSQTSCSGDSSHRKIPANLIQGLFRSNDDHNRPVGGYAYNSWTYGDRCSEPLPPPSSYSSSCSSSDKVPERQLLTANVGSTPQPSTHARLLQFSNSGPNWKVAAGGGEDVSAVRTRFFPPQIPEVTTDFDEKPKDSMGEGAGSGTVAAVKKSASDQWTGMKRGRSDVAPPMPPLKVRKEKMGDRITALQQLVSPFGKSDTASVLSEAIEYINFLHQQVTALSTPYMSSAGAPIQRQQVSCRSIDPENLKHNLQSRGLCLVPIMSTFPITHETPIQFWTPTFGEGFN